jgi:chromosome partitioning protein
MPAPVIAVLNMKGGVGKTTLAANLAREIFGGKVVSVLLIDLDPQFNLTQQLIKEAAYDKEVAAAKTALRMFEPAPASDFFDVNTTTLDPPSAKSISVSLRYFIRQPEKNISLIPGTFELTKYSFVEDGTKLNHAKAFFKKFISQARSEFDLVIIDMNPSSSFLTYAGLSVATDILSPVRPDKFSMLGLGLVRKLIEHKSLPAAPRLHIIMNGVQRSEGVTETEKQIRAAPFFKDAILANRAYFSKVLTARSDYTGFASDRGVAHRDRIASELRAAGLELIGRMGM